jgi:hypothetical protein
MALTYEPIASVTASGSSSNQLVMSSIPSTYTDLILVIDGSLTASAVKTIKFNADTAANYSCTVAYGTGSGSGASSRYSESYLDVVNAGSNKFNTVVHINNYANTTTFKTYLSRHNSAAVSAEAVAGLWRSTAAINQINIYTSSNAFSSGTTFTLFGIKAA